MRLPGWFLRRRHDDLDEELRGHIRMAVQERVERGEQPAEAEEAARREFGNVDLVGEVTRDMWGWRWVDRLTRDIRHGARLLGRSPAFAAAVVASLALGIGANSVIFSVFNSLLWTPLPVADADRLLVAYTQGADPTRYEGFSFAELQDYSRQDAIEDVSLVASWNFALSVAPGGEAVQVTGEPVSAHYFGLLAPRMHLGRGLLPGEASTPGREAVAVLGYRLWTRLFASDPAVVGRTITLNGHSLKVVGVTGPDFRGTWSVFVAPDIWVPITMLASLYPAHSADFLQRGDRTFRLLGRLRSGATVDQAQAVLTSIASRLASTYPDTNRGRTVRVFRELETRPVVEAAGSVDAVAFGFLAVTALVLVNACANVATLLLARAASRRREVATRIAMGASRGQLVRQFLVEAVSLSIPAGAAALGVAYVVSRLIGAMRFPSVIPFVVITDIDGRVALFTVGLALASGLAFGLVPALRATRLDPAPVLKTGGWPEPWRGLSLTNGLVVGQVAISLLLLIIGGLLLRNVGAAEKLDPGFSTARRLVADFSPSMVGYDVGRAQVFYRDLVGRIRTLPGVESAALVRHMPLHHSSLSADVVVEGRVVAPERERIEVNYSVADEAYFSTAGTSIRRGRAFDERDTADSPPVVIVNETFARRYFGGEDPIGRRIREVPGATAAREIVGVAADGKYLALFESPRPYLFIPYAQQPLTNMMLLVSCRGDAAEVARDLRRAVRTIDAAVPLFRIQTIEEFMAMPRGYARAMAMMAVPGALVAAALAALGLGGVLAHTVSRKTREVGIRIAIGAGPVDVVGLVLRQGLTLAFVGMVIGLAASFAVARLMAGLLLGVSTTDPIVFLSVPALLVVAAAAACLAPVRRALRIDPVAVLRHD